MADNVAISEGTGTTIAADDVGGVKYQRVKIAWGVDGAAVDASATDPMPVVQTGTPALPTGAATAANQATANTALGAPADAAATTDAGTFSLIALFKRLLGKLTTQLPAALAANGGLKIEGVAGGVAVPVQAGGYTGVAFGSMTRPADTTAYAAGDGVTSATSSASAMSVTSAARTSAGSGVLFGGKATKSTVSTTNAQFRLWIYQDTPTAIPNDNAAFTAAVLADYQKLVCTATVDFFASGIVGSDGVEAPITFDRPSPGFKLASGTTLTVIWEARGAYPPGNAEVFRLALDIAQD